MFTAHRKDRLELEVSSPKERWTGLTCLLPTEKMNQTNVSTAHRAERLVQHVTAHRGYELICLLPTAGWNGITCSQPTEKGRQNRLYIKSRR